METAQERQENVAMVAPAADVSRNSTDELDAGTEVVREEDPPTDQNATEPAEHVAVLSSEHLNARETEIDVESQRQKAERIRLAEKLHVAVVTDDVAQVAELLERGALPRFENHEGKFAIHIAAHHCCAKVTKLLLEISGVTIDDRDTSGKTQLFCEAESGNHEAVQFLLEHGAIVDAEDLEHKTALFAAAGNGHLDVVRVLVEKGANVHKEDQHLRTPLFLAAKNGHLEIVEFLASCKASVDVKQKIGRTPLMFAASNGHLDVVKYLLDRNPASIATKDQNNWKALHVAAGNGRSEIVELLIAKDATVNGKGPDGATPLYLAAQRGNVDIVTMLLEKGADVNLKQNQGKTPLLAAAENGFADVVKLLINAGASVHDKDESGSSSLLVAVSKGSIEIVKILLTRETSVNEKDVDGRTPLMAAAKHGRLEISRLLIENGAHIDDKQKFGRTPLMLAISNRRREVVKLLLDCGASVEAKDDKGWSPLHIAAGSKQPDIVRQLIDKKAKIDDCTQNGSTPLDLGIQKGVTNVINLLLQSGQSTVYKKPDYDALLISAARSGHISIFKFLVDSGASLHTRASDGETVLLSTARWGFRGYFKLLVRSSSTMSSTLPDRDASLLSGTLKTMRKLCDEVSESQALYSRVVERLTDIGSEIQDTDNLRSDTKALTTFADIVYRFSRHLLRCRSRRTVSRFIAKTTDNSNLRDLHEEIDNFMKKFGINSAANIHKDWQTAWTSDQTKQRALFRANLADGSVLDKELSKEEDKLDAVTHLKFMLSNRGRQDLDDKSTTKSVISRLICGGDAAPEVPTWFVSQYNIEIEDWSAVGESRFVKGKWMKSIVMINKCDLELAQFKEIATTWKRLGHPNVLDLFGACHVAQPRFFVCKSSENGTLQAYLRKHKDRAIVFTKLHETAQGMLFLRERKIVHGDLTTNKILVGEDGKAKISGFELAIFGGSNAPKLQKNLKREFINWKAPELQRGERPTFASDTYALGVCILDILTMEDAWRVRFGSSLRHYLLRNSSAPPPGIVSGKHWNLVKEMCAPNPEQRVSIGYVVSILESFISVAEIDQLVPPSKAGEPEKDLHPDLETWTDSELNATIGEHLQLLKTRCTAFPEFKHMAEHIHSRLQDVFALISGRNKSSADTVFVQFIKIVKGFDSYLKTAVTEASQARRLRSQKVAFGHHTFHTKIDRLLEDLKVPESDSIREWMNEYEEHARNLSVSVRAQDGSTAPIITLQSIKASKHGESTSEAIQIDSPGPDSPNQDWFLRISEIEYDQNDVIAEGGFGTIYRGVWLRGTQVVIKFIGDNKDVSDRLFLHEVNIWHQLQHPHVVRLWGACNVGKRYFVCEYASIGTLSGYLKSQPKDLAPEKLLRLKWKLLHEAALGLQYVHGKNVIHNDLKCDNILIGDDGKAKLTDFGLSSMPNVAELTFHTKKIGAIHWKAPEYVETGKPSFASDIYSFAMCILEAVTGDIPWGRNAVETSVRRWLRLGNLPLRPEGMEDNQWDLIELMTRKDPTQRVGISFVVGRLQEITDDETSARTEL